MFRHQGKTRNAKHNLRIASFLSFVAGIVNVAGFLSIQRLTTNVTGHFAFFVDEVFKLNFWGGLVYFLYIFFFLLGSFFSSLLTEIIIRMNERYIYVIPISIEIIILMAMAIFGKYLVLSYPNFLACSLLFAMGLQNSLVTKISNSIVRTTHLTGLFTDLGIELSQLFFYKSKEAKARLFTSITLRLTIIVAFFVGGVVSGVFFDKLHLYVLFIAALALLIGLFYDSFRYRIIFLRRKYG